MQLHGRQGNTNELSSQIGNGFLRNGRVRPQGDEFREKPPISFHDRASPVPDPFATSPSFHQEDIRRSFDPTRDLPALPDGGEEGEKKCGDPLPPPGSPLHQPMTRGYIRHFTLLPPLVSLLHGFSQRCRPSDGHRTPNARAFT